MNKGKIIRVVGPVVDVEFTADNLPAIYNAVVIRTEDQDDKNFEVNLTLEVEQHLGKNTVRCVAMSATDGLVRGMVAVDTGSPITVPVGDATLGRLLNVVGEAIDEQGQVEGERWGIHREAPTFAEQNAAKEILETGIKVIDLLCPYQKGGKIGLSICEDDKLDLALDIMKKAQEKGVNLVLGTDCIAGDKFSNDANTQVVSAMDIPEGWEGMDAGPATRESFANVIRTAKTILWNGPAGVFEFDNFADGSKAIAEAIVEATENGAFSLVGGGDSVACVNKFGLADKVSYVSTGGGALLEAIEGKVLPGVAAIKG